MSRHEPAALDLSQELTRGFAARFIRYKTAQLISRPGFSPTDREDLEQELKLHLLQRCVRFDPQVAHWNAFVVTVLSRHLLTLVLKRRRGKPLRSLEEFTDDAEAVGDGGESAGLNGHATLCIADNTAQLDLVLDVQTVLARMPHDSRVLCRRLMSASPAAVARQLGVPRTTLYRRIIGLRKQFRRVAKNSEKNFASLFRQTQ